MENRHMSELSQKRSQAPRWAKTSIFSIFWKVFKDEENDHIFTPGQLKYKNSLIWMKNVHVWIESKKFPRSGMGENFNFFYFFEFSKMKKIIIFSLQEN